MLQKRKKLPGRPTTKIVAPATRHNWQSPILWLAIDASAVRNGFSPTAIVKDVQRRDRVVYAKLTSQVVGTWIHRALGEPPRWKDVVLARAGKGYKVGGDSTRIGILAPYPDAAAVIVKRLKVLRDAGVPLAPEVFELRSKDGKTFTCSDAWIRSFLHNAVGFSPRRPTRAAQKVPVNALELGDKLLLRFAHLVEKLFIGTAMTWASTGAKQVSVVGQEEKRAFTLNVGVSMDGVLLPFQAIYCGKSTRSLPSANAPGMDRAKQLSFLFEYSNTQTYWSTQETMRSYVTNVLVPYFERRRIEFGCPEDQYFIWQPRIIMLFVPAGCTGLFQPCDVGMQRVIKHALKRASHVDIVAETVSSLEDGTAAEAIHLDSRVGTLRDRSVQWMLKAFEAGDNVELVKKAWQMCTIGDQNLSYEAITSRAVRERLQALPQTMPKFWEELNTGAGSLAMGEESDPPTLDQTLDDETDDTAVPTADIVEAVLGNTTDESLVQQDGRVFIDSAAESDSPEVVFGTGSDEINLGDAISIARDTAPGATVPDPIASTSDADTTDDDWAPGRMKLLPQAPRAVSSRSRREAGWYLKFNDWAV